MSPIRKDIDSALDLLTEEQQQLVYALVRQFVAEPDTDDVLTVEDLLAVKEGHEEFLRGETTPHDQINWD